MALPAHDPWRPVRPAFELAQRLPKRCGAAAFDALVLGSYALQRALLLVASDAKHEHLGECSFESNYRIAYTLTHAGGVHGRAWLSVLLLDGLRVAARTQFQRGSPGHLEWVREIFENLTLEYTRLARRAEKSGILSAPPTIATLAAFALEDVARTRRRRWREAYYAPGGRFEQSTLATARWGGGERKRARAA